MSVKKIGENKYRVLWTTQKCEIETNCSLEQLQEMCKRIEMIDRAYPTMWSNARKLHWQLETFKQSTDETIWWKIVDPVIRYNNPCEYEG